MVRSKEYAGRCLVLILVLVYAVQGTEYRVRRPLLSTTTSTSVVEQCKVAAVTVVSSSWYSSRLF